MDSEKSYSYIGLVRWYDGPNWDGGPQLELGEKIVAPDLAREIAKALELPEDKLVRVRITAELAPCPSCAAGDGEGECLCAEVD